MLTITLQARHRFKDMRKALPKKISFFQQFPTTTKDKFYPLETELQQSGVISVNTPPFIFAQFETAE